MRWLGISAWLVACAQPAAGDPVAAARAADRRAAAAPAGSDGASQPPEPKVSGGWVRAIAGGDWETANRLMAAAPADRTRSAGFRFARARVLSALGRCGAALPLLSGLGEQLPLLRGEVQRDRAECALEQGLYSEAGAYFSQQGSAGDALRAATAYDLAGDAEKALREANVALHRAKKIRRRAEKAEVEAEVRYLRAKLLANRGDEASAVVDLRWIAIEAPTVSIASTARSRLNQIAPTRRLTKDECYERAMELARDGQLAEALGELDQLETALGKPVPEAKIAHARGWAYYYARDYAKAAELLTKASALSAEFRVKDAFYAARALSRANQDKAAIARYEALAQNYPAAAYAEEARYLIGRLHFTLGEYEAADKRLSAYIKRYGRRGRFRASAAYELALVQLATGRFPAAVSSLQSLVASAGNDRERAALTELLGVALAGSQKREEAVETFRAVVREHPLSFAALASSARLVELGEVLPRPIAPARKAPRAEPLVLRLPEKVSLLARFGFDVEAESELDRVATRWSAAYAPRSWEALCEAYGLLATAKERYRTAQKIVRAAALDEAPNAANRWAWECMYPRPYDWIVGAAEQTERLPEDLLYAVMRQESAFKPAVVSPAQAVGLLQMIPPTAKRVASELGLEYEPEMLARPARNIPMGAHYLRRLLNRFEDEVPIVLAAYNAGPQAASRWLEAGESLPLDIWVATIPYSETRHYVRRVLGNLARYAYLRGGEAEVPRLDLTLPKGLRAKPEDY